MHVMGLFLLERACACDGIIIRVIYRTKVSFRAGLCI